VLSKGFVSDLPLDIHHASGEVTQLMCNAAVFRSHDGLIQGVYAAGRDVSQLKRVQDELRRHQEHLEELVSSRTEEPAKANDKLKLANGEMESFAYSVSHDLRVPLRAIDGFSRVLLEDYSEKLDSDGSRLLNVVHDNTIKMGHLIDDILAFSRVGRVEMAQRMVDMEAAVRSVLIDLEAVIRDRKVQFDIKPLPHAHGDGATLQRVWANLIENAVKYSGQKPESTIEIGAIPGDRETVYYVKDNGAGFDMQFAEKLFGVFQRLHSSEFPGTGIGLAIVKRIVTRHGGRVWAEGKVNEGATFYFALPAATADQGNQA
jgi:light-regulated signal transduction histidine kinase (bacteriophytochrome)